MQCTVANTGEGATDEVNSEESTGLGLVNLEILRSDREPALTEAVEAKFKQGLIAEAHLQHLFSFWVVGRYCALITWRFTEGTLQRGPLGDDWFGTV